MPDTSRRPLTRRRAPAAISNHCDSRHRAAEHEIEEEQDAGRSSPERRPPSRRALRRAGMRHPVRTAGLTAVLALACAVRAGAQVPQPVVAAAPAEPQFFSSYDFHLTASGLLHETDPLARYSWDTHFGGSADLADYVGGRASVTVDYQAVLGSEYRAFDPNQGNYILEASASGRAPHTELVGVFHHVSRHLSDRPKRPAVAWNTFGGRVLHRLTLGGTTIDADLDLGWVTQRAFVDYTWIGSLDLQVRHDVAPHVAVFAHASGQLYGVDELVARRSLQRGGIAEGGIRLRGAAGVLELFAGVERRVDAFPVERTAEHWGLAGFRLLSR